MEHLNGNYRLVMAVHEARQEAHEARRRARAASVLARGAEPQSRRSRLRFAARLFATRSANQPTH